MKDGLMYKFGNGVDADVNLLRERLLNTGKRELFEASPSDRIWGIGFSISEAKKTNKRNFGSNLLGKALMEVREHLSNLN